MVVVFIQAPNRDQLFRTSELAGGITVFPANSGLQGQSAVGPELPLAAEPVRGLNQSHRQRRAYRPQVRNLSQLGGDCMLPIYRYQFPPRLLTQVLQHVQLLVELLGSPAAAGFPNLGQPFGSMGAIKNSPFPPG